MKINWTKRAYKSYDEIIENLLERWSKKQVDEFINQTNKTIEQIQQNPYMYQQVSDKNKHIRKGFVNRFTSMFYQVRPKKEEINILKFWDNRRNPDKNDLNKK